MEDDLLGQAQAVLGGSTPKGDLLSEAIGVLDKKPDPKFMDQERRMIEARQWSVKTGGGDAPIDRVFRGLGIDSKKQDTRLGTMLRPRDLAMPFQNAITSIGRGITGAENPHVLLKKAQEAYAKGEATDEQLARLAITEYEQNRDKQLGLGASIAKGAAQAAPMLGEALVGGQAVKGAIGAAGYGAKLAPAATATGRALQSGGIQAAATPLTPSLWLDESQQRAAQNGGNWYDPKNVAAPMLRAAFQNAIMGHLGEATKGMNVAKRIGAGAVLMPAEQAGADALTTLGEKAWKAAGMDEKWTTDTDWGTVKRLANSDTRNEGIKELAVQSMMGSMFSAFHGGKSDPVKKMPEALESLKKEGVPQDLAERVVVEATNRPPETIKNPEVKAYVESIIDLVPTESPKSRSAGPSPEPVQSAAEAQKPAPAKPQTAREALARLEDPFGEYTPKGPKVEYRPPAASERMVNEVDAPTTPVAPPRKRGLGKKELVLPKQAEPVVPARVSEDATRPNVDLEDFFSKPAEAAPAPKPEGPLRKNDMLEELMGMESAPPIKGKETYTPPEPAKPVEPIEEVERRIMEGTREPERRRPEGLKLVNPEKLTLDNAKLSEVADLEKFGDNHFRLSIADDAGKVIGEARIGSIGDTIHVPVLFKHGLEFGEGRGKAQPFGAKEMKSIAEQIAMLDPEAKKLVFTRSEGNIRAGVEREIDLTKVRNNLAKKVEKAQPADREVWETGRDEYVEAAGKKVSGQTAPKTRKLAKTFHAVAVRQAVESGKKVPPEVLKDYPEFAEKEVKSQPETPVEPPKSAEPVTQESLQAPVIDHFNHLLKEKHGVIGMVPIHEVRAEIAKKYGKKAASHAVFDETLNDLRREGKIWMISASDRSKLTPQHLQDGVPGVGETFVWMEMTDKTPGTSKDFDPWADQPKETANAQPEPSPAQEGARSEEARPAEPTPEQAQPDPEGFGQPLTPEEKNLGMIRGASPDADTFPRMDNLKELALANENVDAERKRLGLPPLMAAARKTYGEFWDQAMVRLGKDPNASADLVNELSKKMRNLDEVESALLLHRHLSFNNAYERTIRQASAAAFEAHKTKNYAEFERLSDKANELLAQYKKIGDLTRATGSVAGRVLGFRRQLAAEDFTLGKMTGQLTVAKKAPLSPVEVEKVTAMHDKIAALEARLRDFENKEAAEADVIDLQPAEQPGIVQKVKDWLGGIFKPKAGLGAKKSKAWDFADRMEQEAAKELMSKYGPGKLFSGFDPTGIPALAKYTAAKIIKTGLTFADFSSQIVARFGDAVRPHLKEIWDGAQKQVAIAQLDKTDVQVDLKKTKSEYAEMVDTFKRKNQSVGKKLWEGTKETNNIMRAIQTAWDVSAVGRQGGPISLSSPTLVPAAVKDMVKSLKSERGYERLQQEILNRKNAFDYRIAELEFTDHNADPTKQEESLMGRYVQKLPGLAASSRAFNGYLNRLRADKFDAMALNVTSTGETRVKELKAIANYINAMTGRGKTGYKRIDDATQHLAQVFFSPRHALSRFQVLSGQPFWGAGTWKAKKMIAKEYAKYAIGMGAVYGLAKLVLGDEAEVEKDPRSSDFGKIKIGRTRLDPLAGFSQSAVVASRLATGESKMPGTNEVKDLRGPGHKFKDPTTFKVAGQFVRNKMSPLGGEVSDRIFPEFTPPGVGPITDATGRQKGSLGWGIRQADKFLPLTSGDIYDAFKEHGVSRGAAIALLSLLGWGSQVHEKQKK